jgi:hypothetical protein
VVAGFVFPYFVGEGFGVGSAIGAAITLIGLTDLGRRMLTQSPEQTSAEKWRTSAAVPAEIFVAVNVARVLMKLGLRDRVQAVIYAYEHRLVQPGGD